MSHYLIQCGLTLALIICLSCGAQTPSSIDASLGDKSHISNVAVADVPQFTNQRSITLLISGASQYKFAVSSVGQCEDASYSTFRSTTDTVEHTFDEEESYVICLIGADNAGIQQPIPTLYPIAVDWSPPAIRCSDLDGTLPSVEIAAELHDATPVQVEWTMVSGPGEIRFTNAKSLFTEIIASQIGLYTLRLSAIDAAGNQSQKSVILTFKSTVLDPVPVNNTLTPPQLSGIGFNELVTLSWTDAPEATAYDIYWSENSEVDKYSAKFSEVSSPFQHHNLLNGRTYFYTIVAKNSAGESPLSSVFSIGPLGVNHPIERSFQLARNNFAMTSNFVINGTSRSFSAWVKRLGTSNWESLLIQTTNVTSNAGISAMGLDWKYNNSGKIQLHISDGTTSDTTDGADIPLDTWTHVAGVITGSELILFINGSVVAQKTSNILPFQSSAAVVMGRYGTVYSEAQIADPKIFSYALSAAEVTALATHNIHSSNFPIHPVWATSFSAGSGVLSRDLSGNGHDANIIWAADGRKRLADVPNVLTGKSLEFDGTMSVQSEDTFALTGDRTFAVWVRSFGNTSYNGIFGQTTSVAAIDSKSMTTLQFTNGQSDIVNFNVGDGTSHYQLLATSIAPRSIWIHWTGIVRGTVAELYRNGVLESSHDLGWTPFSAAKQVVMGKMGTKGFSGRLKDARVYSRALSATEVLDLSEGRTPSATGLELHWKLDETETLTDTVNDATSNDRSGTIFSAKNPAGGFSTDVPTFP